MMESPQILDVGLAATVVGVAGMANGTDTARLAAGVGVVLAASWLLTRLGGGSGRSSFDTSLRPAVAPTRDRPDDLVQAERAVQVHATTGDVHLRLRPILRDIAMGQLRSRRGIDLDRDADEAAALLGDRLFELVRAERPVPSDRRAPSGVTIGDVSGFVATLEAL